MRALDIAATGMVAQQTNVEVISHNLANQTTTGYKRVRAEFQDLLYQNLRRVGTQSSDANTTLPTGLQVGMGVKTAATYRNHMQGSVKRTDNALDVAIEGRGFLQVTMPDGRTAYTRAGTLQLSNQGEIVTIDGYLVSPNITVPQDAVAININASGQVEVQIDGQNQPQNLGQFDLINFVNPAGLETIGDNLYLQTFASGDPIQGRPGELGFGQILQGYIENSNVDPVTEITGLITAQRAYEMNSKIISATEQMMQALSQNA